MISQRRRDVFHFFLKVFCRIVKKSLFLNFQLKNIFLKAFFFYIFSVEKNVEKSVEKNVEANFRKKKVWYGLP